MRPIQPIDSDHGIDDAFQIVTLGGVFQASFVRVAAIIGESDVAGDLSIMAKLRSRAVAFAFDGFRIASAAASVDKIAENLFGLGGALLGHHGVRILRGCLHSKYPANNQTSEREPNELQPHKTDPPFTLMISPVRKLANSDARKRIGPAISSAVAARPSGIAAATALAPAFV